MTAMSMHPTFWVGAYVVANEFDAYGTVGDYPLCEADNCGLSLRKGKTVLVPNDGGEGTGIYMTHREEGGILPLPGSGGHEALSDAFRLRYQEALGKLPGEWTVEVGVVVSWG